MIYKHGHSNSRTTLTEVEQIMRAGDHSSTHVPLDLRQIISAEESALKLFNAGYKREAISLINHAQRSAEIYGDVTLSINVAKLAPLKELFNAADVVIGLHQPTYLPWLGYLHKIYYADKFAIQDDVQFTRKSFIKRALIKKPNSNESTYLSIPAKKHSDRCGIKEIEIDNSEDWRAEHLRKIHAAYSKEAYFNEFFPKLENSLADTRDDNSLVNVTNALLFFLLDVLKIEREIVVLSNLTEGMTFPNAHERNMTMCRMLGGTIYFSGAGARKYHDGYALPEKMKLIYQNMANYLSEHPYLPKEQFINGLSSLDALFCIGPKRIIDIFEDYENPAFNKMFCLHMAE